MGNMQATLYGQIKALRREILGATTLTFRCTLRFSLGWCVMRSGL